MLRLRYVEDEELVADVNLEVEELVAELSGAEHQHQHRCHTRSLRPHTLVA
jgi:hypothetical protein